MKQKLIKIGVVGTGFISRGFINAVEDDKDILVAKVLTRRDLKNCREFPRRDLLTTSVEELIDNSDIVLECSGDVIHATNVVKKTMDASIPVVTMNAEFHVTTGSYFVGKGILSEAEGDQPGSLAALYENVVQMGFKPLVCGNVKGFQNLAPTVEEMKFWAKKQGISLPMVTAATDGTKMQFEQALVANGFGLGIAKEGLLGYRTDDIHTTAMILADDAKRLGYPISDYVLSAKSPIRVFIVATHDKKHRDALEYYKLGKGPDYLFPQNTILCHFEIIKTIRRLLSEGKILLDNSEMPRISVAAVAKRDLKRGEIISQGIGSFDVRGIAVNILDNIGHVPIGLLKDAVIKRPVEKGQKLNFNDIEIPESLALKAWQEIEERVKTNHEAKGLLRTTEMGRGSARILPRVEGQSQECRVCNGETFVAIDLGHHPFANALVEKPGEAVKTYPLTLLVCKECSMAQLSYCANDQELYGNYNYITPDSNELRAHYKKLIGYLQQKGYMDGTSRVLEIGSNIGRFLEFIKPYVHSVLGVDPAINICQMANERGIPTVNDFFNKVSAKKIIEEYGKHDLVFARHCFAHNEKPWLMLEGVQRVLSKEGFFIIENAYFYDTVARCEFDQIYHEHMYYYTLRSISKILAYFHFKLVDAYHSDIHGGTMVYVAKLNSSRQIDAKAITPFLVKEKNMHKTDHYHGFRSHIEKNKTDLRRLLDELRAQNKSIHAYGASAKSTTLFNYYKIDKDIIPFVVDSTITKRGKYIPLANIKVISEEDAKNNPPDYYLLTIWNYKDEIIKKVRSWGNKKTKFIVPHPRVEIIT